MRTLFATNKTWKISGMTRDTMEGYISIMSFEIVERNNPFSDGTYFQARTVSRSTTYTDEVVDYSTQKEAKAGARAEAEAEANRLNTYFGRLRAE